MMLIRWSKIIIVLIICVYTNTVFADSPLTGFNKNKDLPILNNKLSRLDHSIRNKVFDAWETKSNATIYKADKDGFVVAYRKTAGIISGYTESSSPTTTVRIEDNYSICMPVRKNDYWKATGATLVYWLPYKN